MQVGSVSQHGAAKKPHAPITVAVAVGLAVGVSVGVALGDDVRVSVGVRDAVAVPEVVGVVVGVTANATIRLERRRQLIGAVGPEQGACSNALGIPFLSA